MTIRSNPAHAGSEVAQVIERSSEWIPELLLVTAVFAAVAAAVVGLGAGA